MQVDDGLLIKLGLALFGVFASVFAWIYKRTVIYRIDELKTQNTEQRKLISDLRERLAKLEGERSAIHLIRGKDAG